MKNDLFEDLNEAQREAVKHQNGPALVIAGPGSGKTRVLTHHAAYLVQENLTLPTNIFLCTFTNKAADEMKERLRKIFRSEIAISWSGTFHSLCARLLRSYGPRFGLDRNFLIYDQSDAKSLIRKIFRDRNFNSGKINPSSILSLISSAKNELIGTEEYPRYALGFLRETAAAVYPLYQKMLRENNAFDFDDLIVETVKLLKNESDFLRIVQDQFEHVLIDEYQDTNKAQYLLSKLISQKRRNLYVVGDVSQAIYSFRGADFRNVLSFEQDFPDAKIYQLSQNYRSTQSIIESARAVIQNNTTHVSLNLWTENEPGEKVKLYEAHDEVDEAQYLVRTIRNYLDQGLSKNLNDFAVFYRTNAQSRIIEEVLLKESLPYLLVGGTEFYERKEIKDVLSFIRLFLNPQETVSLERINKIGKRRAAAYLTSLLKLKEESQPSSQSRPLDVLDSILKQTDYISLLKDGTEEGEMRVENVKELRSVAAAFEDITSFLENVSLIQQEYGPHGRLGKGGGEKEAIRLMTLHAAKGLEFPVVFLSGLEEGLVPHSRSLVDPNALEEERRLCYVGLTRAMKNLHLTYARERLFLGSRGNSLVSRFVSEIPENLISFEQNFF